MPYSGLNDGPTDFLSTSQGGGGSDEPLDFVPITSVGGGSDDPADLIPISSDGGGSDDPADLIPITSVGGGSDTPADYVSTTSVGGGSDGPVSSQAAPVPSPRQLVTGRGYTEPRRDAVYQVATPRLSINMLAGGQYGLAWDGLDDLLAEGIALICTAGPGALTSPAQVSLGTLTSPTIVYPITSMPGFHTAGQVWVIRQVNGLSGIVLSGDPLMLTIYPGIYTGPFTVDVRPLSSLV